MANDEMPPGFGPNDPTAADRAETEYASVDFKLTEHPPSHPPTPEPWIMIQVNEPGLKVLRAGNGFLGLECRSGVTMEEASKLREDLHRLIEGLSYTKFLT